MEGIMKKKLLLGVAALSLSCASVQASHLKIDDQEEAEKVTQSIQSFWDYHDEIRDKILKGFALESQDWEELRKSDHYLAKYIRKIGTTKISQDLTESLQNNSVVEKDSDLFNELQLLNHIVNLY